MEREIQEGGNERKEGERVLRQSSETEMANMKWQQQI